MKNILNIYDKLVVLEQQISNVISYHENNQATFFKNYKKINHLKDIRFSIRQNMQNIENHFIFSTENIAKIEDSCLKNTPKTN